MSNELFEFLLLMVCVCLFFSILGISYMLMTWGEKAIIKAYKWYVTEYTKSFKVHWRHYYSEDLWTSEGFEIVAATNESKAIRIFRSRHRSDYKIMGVNKV